MTVVKYTGGDSSYTITMEDWASVNLFGSSMVFSVVNNFTIEDVYTRAIYWSMRHNPVLEVDGQAPLPINDSVPVIIPPVENGGSSAVPPGTILGPQGPQGYQGRDGTQGPQGYQGSIGTQGVNGVNGFRYAYPYPPPETVIGSHPGDDWLDTSTGLIYTLGA